MRAKNEELKEEILEIVWVAEEDGRTVDKNGVKDLINRQEEDTDEIIDLLEDKGMLESAQFGELRLTEEGRGLAKKVIRRHRLAERLLNDVLEMDLTSIEGPACRFEHAISAEVEEKICTLLGHPDECPHGKVIPPGKCCSESQELVSRAILPLTDVEAGETVRVAYITLSEEGRLSRLSSLGVLPGASVKVEQKFPAFVIELEETNVAIEKEVASNIFVRNGQVSDGDLEDDGSGRDSFLKKIKEKLIQSK